MLRTLYSGITQSKSRITSCSNRLKKRNLRLMNFRAKFKGLTK